MRLSVNLVKDQIDDLFRKDYPVMFSRVFDSWVDRDASHSVMYCYQLYHKVEDRIETLVIAIPVLMLAREDNDGIKFIVDQQLAYAFDGREPAP